MQITSWMVLRVMMGYSVIRDFQSGQDWLNLPTDIRFGQLDIVQAGRNTLVKFGDDTLAVLNKIQANQITAASFTTV